MLKNFALWFSRLMPEASMLKSCVERIYQTYQDLQGVLISAEGEQYQPQLRFQC